jgi:cyanate lyase
LADAARLSLNQPKVSGLRNTRLGGFPVERLPKPKGDRVKITMSGKFLPYKYYGASGNVPEYGFKEG